MRSLIVSLVVLATSFSSVEARGRLITKPEFALQYEYRPVFASTSSWMPQRRQRYSLERAFFDDDRDDFCGKDSS
jgi:hypothetical protein